MLDIVNDTKINQVHLFQGEKSRFNEAISKNQMIIPATGIHKKVIVLMSRRVSCFSRTLDEVEFVTLTNLL